jgi:hypothetical protein
LQLNLLQSQRDVLRPPDSEVAGNYGGNQLHIRFQFFAVTAPLAAGVVSEAVQSDQAARGKVLEFYTDSIYRLLINGMSSWPKGGAHCLVTLLNDASSFGSQRPFGDQGQDNFDRTRGRNQSRKFAPRHERAATDIRR